jgi:hypothetical protein
MVVKLKVLALARYLRRAEKKMRSVYAECVELASYQEAERMAQAGLDDPPTIGFNLAGALEGVLEDLEQSVLRLEQAAAETVEDLLRERRKGTADLGRFRR